ncbi:MAG: hypothetical protein SVV03_03780 [Candidatus Nanohaloarchaea archaeon]|nr:hypothetical protein [Candidatus Nanohaloarchaea archaeon]
MGDDSKSDSSEVELPTDKFIKIYNNLPLEERENTVVVVDDEPISWKMALREMSEETELGKSIAYKLKKLDIL